MFILEIIFSTRYFLQCNPVFPNENHSFSQNANELFVDWWCQRIAKMTFVLSFK